MGYVFAVKGYSKENGKEIMHVEPYWWNQKEVWDDPRLEEIRDGGFADYEAKLSAEELRELNDHFRPLAAEKGADSELGRKMNRERMADLDWAATKGADKFSHFIVGFYDWDSGM